MPHLYFTIFVFVVVKEKRDEKPILKKCRIITFTRLCFFFCHVQLCSYSVFTFGDSYCILYRLKGLSVINLEQACQTQSAVRPLFEL